MSDGHSFRDEEACSPQQLEEDDQLRQVEEDLQSELSFTLAYSHPRDSPKTLQVWRLLCDSSIDKYYYVDLLIISCNLLLSLIKEITMYFNDIIITKVVSHGSLAKATGMAGMN